MGDIHDAMPELRCSETRSTKSHKSRGLSRALKLADELRNGHLVGRFSKALQSAGQQPLGLLS